MPFKHHRRYPRVEIPLLIQYRVSPEAPLQVDYARDVSRNGLFVLAEHQLIAGSRVEVFITTRDGRQVIKGHALVVRADSGGYAVELEGFDEAARALLDAVIEDAVAARTRPRAGPRARRRSEP